MQRTVCAKATPTYEEVETGGKSKPGIKKSAVQLYHDLRFEILLPETESFGYFISWERYQRLLKR